MVQNIGGVPRTIAKVKRKVRLASGLDQDNTLSMAAMERGWDCLSLFAERLENIPKQNIKIVSTATLRLAQNAKDFCQHAEKILNLPINIISGEQEAALIYHGMAVSSHSADKRLIIDIGGASTELILGEGFKPLVLNSLHMGCVTWLEQYFSDDLINQHNLEQAKTAAINALSAVKQDYLNHQWQLSLGASGSIQAVQEVLVAQGLNEQITVAKLEAIVEQVLVCQTLSELDIVGLKSERKLVFVSGLVILLTLFQELNIDVMIASGGALREGLIDELISTDVPDDIRLHCCEQLQQRFQLDTTHARDVSTMAQALARQLAYEKLSELDIEMLGYAGLLHEIGTSIEFLQAQKHGQYLLSKSPMSGFSKEQRKIVAALVGCYKNPIKQDLSKQQAWCCNEVCQLLVSCLRLSVIIVGRGQGLRRLAMSFSYNAGIIELTMEQSLWGDNPLLVADLQQETLDNKFIKLLNR